MARVGVLPSFSVVSRESLNLSEHTPPHTHTHHHILICKPGQYRTRFTIGGTAGTQPLSGQEGSDGEGLLPLLGTTSPPGP